MTSMMVKVTLEGSDTQKIGGYAERHSEGTCLKVRLRTAINRTDFRFRCMLISEEQADG